MMDIVQMLDCPFHKEKRYFIQSLYNIPAKIEDDRKCSHA